MNKFPEVLVIENEIFKDNRGHFFESWRKDLDLPNFVQENCSFSKKNVLRGLHFQTGFAAQGKFIQVLNDGLIFDVAVDINICSPTYGQWAGIKLDKSKSLYLPPGFAHGFFCVKSAIILYKCTNYYCKEAEKTIIWSDSDLNIDWPEKDINKLLISDKDRQGIEFRDLQ